MPNKKKPRSARFESAGFVFTERKCIVSLTSNAEHVGGRFKELFEELSPHEQHMYRELQQDVQKARDHSKALWGLISCAGWFHVVIIPAGVEFPRGLASRRKFESHLRLNPASGVTEVVIMKLLKVLAAESSARIERPHHCNETAFFGIPELCIEYVIDTRSR